jgi:lipopolysaccharide export system permease protein
MIFGRMEAYLAGSVIWAVLAAMMLLTALLGFSELLSQLGRISEHYPLSKALIFALLKMPAYAYDVFPMALLIGVLAGLGQLASQGELTIIRASGWSPSRLLLALIKGLILLWLVMLLVGEGVAPWAEKTAMQLRLSNGAQHLSLAGDAGFWMKEGQRYIAADSVVQADLLLGVDIYQRDVKGNVSKIWQAEQAAYRDGIGWTLVNVREQWLSTGLVEGAFPFVGLKWQEQYHESQSVSLPFEPQALALMAQDKKNWSWSELRSQIETMSANGMQTQTLELALWRKLAHPVSLFAMLALAIPLLLHAGRSASMGGRVLLGIVIGLVFFLLNRVVGDMASLADFPPLVSAFTLPTLVLILGLIWLRRIR